MKTSRYVRCFAIASIAMAPLAAHSASNGPTKACIEAFVAQNFPGQTPTIKVEKYDSFHSTLAFSVPFSLKLSAANRSGEVLASATCKSREGIVTLTSDQTATLIAAR